MERRSKKYVFLIAFFFYAQNLVKADLTDSVNDELMAKPVPKEEPLDKADPIKPLLKPEKAKEDPASRKEPVAPKKKEGAKVKRGRTPGEEDKMPLKFRGESLKGSKKSGLITLEKNVFVERGSLLIKADMAKIFFDQEEDEVSSVFAEGHLKMERLDEKTGEKIFAAGQTAEYLAKDQLIILKGDAELTKGKDVISGDYIRYHVATGIVEGGKVKGLVQPAN